jgi:hypothetical protein
LTVIGCVPIEYALKFSKVLQLKLNRGHVQDAASVSLHHGDVAIHYSPDAAVTADCRSTPTLS